MLYHWLFRLSKVKLCFSQSAKSLGFEHDATIKNMDF